MGNSVGNLSDYWKVIRESRQLQGGFIWDWVDQAYWKAGEMGDGYWAYGGDFGPESRPSDRNFLCNGLLFPDRKLHPHALEVRKVYQPVDFEAVDLKKGRLKIWNRFDFICLKGFEFVWALEADGTTVAEGRLPPPAIPAHGSAEITVPIPPLEPESGVGYFLRIGAVTRNDAPLLPRGHKIAWEQFPLPLAAPDAGRIEKWPALELDETAGRIRIEGKTFTLVFDKTQGTIASLMYSGVEFIEKGPVPDFWRAPTDNDYGNGMPVRCSIWREAGGMRTIDSVALVATEPGVARIEVDMTLPSVRSKYRTVYTIFGSADILVENSFLPGPEELPELPRFGTKLILPERFGQLTWFGRGPHESYWDRKTSAAVGLYQGSVMAQYHPYVRPQENGNKTDVRWLALTDGEGTGLLAVGMPLLDIGASHHDIGDFEYAPEKDQRHPNDIIRRPWTAVNLDYKQMGVGGDNSWGARPHEEYQLPARPYSYKFRLRPFVRGDDRPSVLSKQRFPSR
jgi:beta-galactosidase